MVFESSKQSQEIRIGKALTVEHPCADDENNEGNCHTKKTALNCRSDVNGLIVHENKLGVQVSHDDSSTAALRYFILFFGYVDELIILRPCYCFRIQSEWVQDVTFCSNTSIFHVQSIPADLLLISTRNRLNARLIKARLGLQKLWNNVGQFIRINLPRDVCIRPVGSPPFTLAYRFAVIQITIDVKRCKLLNEAVHLANPILALDQPFVLIVRLELVAKVKEV
mmetsp:Transcript_9760/g.23881  ORF Transcript_9760/g.23881 Transcript_9760/m.23881 type:complete len:224 (-) Transcript_9760:2315-2986(-)